MWPLLCSFPTQFGPEPTGGSGSGHQHRPNAACTMLAVIPASLGSTPSPAVLGEVCASTLLQGSFGEEASFLLPLPVLSRSSCCRTPWSSRANFKRKRRL